MAFNANISSKWSIFQRRDDYPDWQKAGKGTYKNTFHCSSTVHPLTWTVTPLTKVKQCSDKDDNSPFSTCSRQKESTFQKEEVPFRAWWPTEGIFFLKALMTYKDGEPSSTRGSSIWRETFVRRRDTENFYRANYRESFPYSCISSSLLQCTKFSL